MPVPSGFIPRNNLRENYVTCCDECQYQSDKNSKKLSLFCLPLWIKPKKKASPEGNLLLLDLLSPFYPLNRRIHLKTIHKPPESRCINLSGFS